MRQDLDEAWKSYITSLAEVLDIDLMCIPREVTNTTNKLLIQILRELRSADESKTK